MHSLSNMAAVRYFPSIHDNSTENGKIWPVFDGRPKQLNSRNVGSTSYFYNRPRRAGQSSSASRRVEAAWSVLGCPAASEYRPLDVFGVTADDPGPASWGEDEEMCELYIRLKEIELCSMMEETPGDILDYTFQRKIRCCRIKQTRRK